MYRLAVPVMNASLTRETRGRYLELFKMAGAERVFLVLPRAFGHTPAWEAEMEAMGENIRFLEANGLEAGAWIATMGHGGALDHENQSEMPDFTRLRGFQGKECEDSFCVTDERFTSAMCGVARDIARRGARIIMLDDDFRLAYRAYGLGCCCDNHMRLFREKTGNSLSAKELGKVLFSGRNTCLRTAWLDMLEETMMDFARAMRRAVDEVEPAVRLGFCCVPSSFDTDGTDVVRLTRAFAGDAEPFLRLSGAPYWAVVGWHAPLPDIITMSRLEADWLRRAPDIELFTEGDVYPRPRYRVPGWLLETFDEAMIADGGTQGILKYMFDYTHTADHETGYLALHAWHREERREIAEAFSGGREVGVCLFEAEHTFRSADIPEELSENYSVLQDRLMSPAAALLDRTVTPVTFEREGNAIAVFGESARYLPEEYFGNGLILDAEAARILAQRGVDTGFVGMERMAAPASETFPDEGETVKPETGGIFYRVLLKGGAEVLSFFGDAPAAYRYRNACGQAFLVYAFDGWTVDRKSPLFSNYCRQSQLHGAIAFLTGRFLPVSMDKEPGVYILAKDRGGRRTVGIWNTSDDPVLPREIALGRAYRRVTFLGDMTGSVSGDRVRLDREVPAHAFMGFVVE